MLFGFGDANEPLEETAYLMEDFVVEYVHALVRTIATPARRIL